MTREIPSQDRRTMPCLHKIFLLTAAATTLLVVPSLHAKTVTLTPADNHVPLSLIVGDTVVLNLPSTPPATLRLIADLPAGSPLTPAGDHFQPAAAGSSSLGVQQFRFNAARPGDTRLVIQFKAVPASASVQPPGVSFAVPVHIDAGEPANASATSSPALVGIFTGDLPCADCSALRTRLALYSKAPNDFTEAFYIRTTTYVDAPHGDLTTADRGTWTVLRGDATDPNATVYQLNPDQSSRTENLLVGRNPDTLTGLDPQLKPIAAGPNLTLKRTR